MAAATLLFEGSEGTVQDVAQKTLEGPALNSAM